jgi:hypothetical protein
MLYANNQGIGFLTKFNSPSQFGGRPPFAHLAKPIFSAIFAHA